MRRRKGERWKSKEMIPRSFLPNLVKDINTKSSNSIYPLKKKEHFQNIKRKSKD
jgi:hypothetical protein